jgi:lipopolysaccharide/colanic/teichoic acid biosynthesis glycosyltransferase
MALTFRTTEYVDPRRWSGRNIANVGFFLLYTRILSLPQLMHVLLGDITLSEIEDYSLL